jgi:hypothetical protein
MNMYVDFRRAFASVLGPLLFTVALLLSLPTGVASQVIQDGFEGAELNPFWTVVQWGGGGTATLTTDQSRTGTQSVRLVNPQGYDSQVHLTHDFGSVNQGRLSVWVYDTTPGASNRYVALNVLNQNVPPSPQGHSFTLSIQDWDPDWYYIHPGDGS